MLQGTRHSSVTHSSRWASQTPSQQLRYKPWTPPDLSRRPEPKAIYEISPGILHRITHRLQDRSNSGKERKVVEGYSILEEKINLGISNSILEEKISLGISKGELDTEHEIQLHEMQAADYPCLRYELGDSTPKRRSFPIGGLPDSPRSHTDNIMSQDHRLADYIEAQCDKTRGKGDSDWATTSPPRSLKSLPPTPKVPIRLSVDSLSTSTGVLDSSLPLASQGSQGSNATDIPYSVSVDPRSIRPCSTTSTQPSQRPCSYDDMNSLDHINPHDDINFNDDLNSESPSYSILDDYASEEERLISFEPTSQSVISQRRSSPQLPRSDGTPDTWARYPDYPTFCMAPLVPLKEVPKSRCSRPESISRDQDMDAKGPGMEIELKPGMDELEEHKQGPRIRQTKENYF